MTYFLFNVCEELIRVDHVINWPSQAYEYRLLHFMMCMMKIHPSIHHCYVFVLATSCPSFMKFSLTQATYASHLKCAFNNSHLAFDADDDEICKLIVLISFSILSLQLFLTVISNRPTTFNH